MKVNFLPLGKSVEVPTGSTILQAAIKAGLAIQSTCGGRGTCGKCKVHISPIDNQLEQKVGPMESDWVLACSTSIHHPLNIYLPLQKDAPERKLALGESKDLAIDPCIQKIPLELIKPNSTDQTPDWERVIRALPKDNISFNRQIASRLPGLLRNARFKVTAVMDEDNILSIEAGNTQERCYGAAIDIGTTTAVVYIMNLLTGEILASGATSNPQQVYGADVISRITYASDEEDGLTQMQEKIIDALNDLISFLCAKAVIKEQEIYQVVAVGNTTMSHLFLGLDPTYLAINPFVPVFRDIVEVEARELGLHILPSAKVILLPNIAGYVGSDTVGVMLAADIERLPGISLVIDIGTNGEMVLAGKGELFTCSTAAGPAFEGAEILHGMRASEGAIEKVQIREDVEVALIPGSAAKGICGSGLIDAIAELREAGILEPSGRFIGDEEVLSKLPLALRERIRLDSYDSEFVLVWGEESATGENIVLTQTDIRKLQLAKGAIIAGIQILLQEMRISIEEVDQVMLAGAFGNSIKKESAVAIGLLPSLPIDKISVIGNAAGEGARRALLSYKDRERAKALSEQAQHIELSAREEFQGIFLKSLSF